MERKWIAGLVGAFAAGLLLAVAGCGGGSKSNVSAPATSTSAHTTKAATPEANAAPTKTKTHPAATTPATTMKNVPKLAVADCRKLSRLGRRMGQALLGHTPAADAKAYADFLHQLADRGPTEFRGDFAVMAEAYGKIANVLASVYPSRHAQPSDNQNTQLKDVAKAVNSNELTHAAGEINTWLAQAC
jgi:hypothetical protein